MESQNILGSHDQDAEHTGDVPFVDNTAPITTGNEIVAFSTVEAPKLETVPVPQLLPDASLSNVLEGRNHDILDILCREYAFADLEIPTGGTPGQVLATWDVFNIFVSQPNVFEKISGFAFLRTDLVLRLEFTTLPTVSGGVMLSYFPDVTALQLSNRTGNRLQLSQCPNLQQSLTTAISMKMHIPWISPLYARDLLSGTGNIGTVVFSRLTPSATNKVNVKAYLSADRESLKLQYPVNSVPNTNIAALRSRILQYVETYNKQSTTSVFSVSEEDVDIDQEMVRESKSSKRGTEAEKMQKSGAISGLLDMGSKISTIATAIPGIGAAAAVAAPILKIGSSLAGAFGLSKPLADKPVRVIKWKPAADSLTSEGVIDCHEFSINKSAAVDAADAPFGSQADEMAVEAIMKTPNIINAFNISTAMPARRVVYSIPLNLIHILRGADGSAFLSHQTWLAANFRQWLANLNFDFDCYMTHFHRVKLRFIVLPSVYTVPAVGTDLPASFDINKVSSAVVEFSGDNINWSIRVEPRLHSSMKATADGFRIVATANETLTNYLQDSQKLSTSYGTMIVVVEVPLQASTNVANNVDVVVSFSADDVKLAVPLLGQPFVPIRQSAESTLGTAYAKMSRSERMIRGSDMLVSNSVPSSSSTSLASCAGDHFLHLRNLLNAFMPFTPELNVDNSSVIYRPTMLRTSSDDNINIDYLDYFAKGFAFHKGGVMMRLSVFGNVIPQNVGYIGLDYSSYNQGAFLANSVVANPNGYIVTTAKDLRRSARIFPVHSSEASIDVAIPYWQPTHMLRNDLTDQISNSVPPILGQSFEPLLFFISRADLDLTAFRAVKDDFRMGFLYALPLHSFNPGDIFSNVAP